MSIDTYYFFLIILGGFAIVWSFRLFNRSTKSLGDFEYLCFSAVWGLVLVGFYSWAEDSKPEVLKVFFENPFAAGLVLFSFGLLIGGVAGDIFHTSPGFFEAVKARFLK